MIDNLIDVKPIFGRNEYHDDDDSGYKDDDNETYSYDDDQIIGRHGCAQDIDHLGHYSATCE